MLVFLFTDIEGSTEKWEKFRDKMAEALKKHDIILKECINKYNGETVKHTGDGVFAVFKKGNPLECAIEIQKRFFKENWEYVQGLRVRIAIHLGVAEKRGNDYYGTDVNKTARILSTGWGGQILLTEEILKNFSLPENAKIIDLGTHKLKDLSEPKRIYQLTHPDLPLKKFPPLNSLSHRPNNLPVQTTSFIGRKKEISEIMKILKNPECRILTITGSGGIGKTRLAIQVGAETIENFTDGVFFVPLEFLDSKELIVNKIADSTGFNFYSREEPVVQLINYLKEKEMLLIMDNFEHIINGAEIVSQILRNTKKIKFLITSREVLKIQGEWIYELKGLEYPGKEEKFEEYDGVKLFIEVARRVKPDFIPSEEDRKWVTKICQIVQGLPLAIEIASAWIKMLSCREIVEEIQKNIDFLSSSLIDIPDRHRSLRAVFDYSWKLLNEDEKKAISCLSVFKGGWTKESAEKVAGVNLVSLLSLINKSLIKKENSRYNMLDLTMKYAEEKLKENYEGYKSITQKYANYYADFINEKKMYMKKPEQKEKFEKPVLKEIENIREAWKYAIENKLLNEIGKFVEPLFFFYEEKARYQEGKLIFEMAENGLRDLKNKEGIILYSEILARLGSFYSSMGFYKEAEVCFEEALKIFKKFNLEKKIAMVYSEFGGISFYLQDYERAEVFFKKALEIAKKLNDKYNISGFINNIGVVYLQTKKYDSAKELFEKSLEICKELNYKKGIAIGFGNLGLIFHYKGRYEKAEEFLKKSLEIEIELENRPGVANTCHNLGLNYKYMGNYNKAKEYYEKALEIRKEIGDRMGISISLNNLANLNLAQENYKEAKEMFLKALEITREMDDKIGETHYLWHIAEVFIREKKPEQLVNYLLETLKKAIQLDARFYIKHGLLSSADFFIMKGDYETALKILIYLKENYKEDFEERVNKKLIELEAEPEILEKIPGEISKKNLKDFTEEIIKKIEYGENI